MDRQATPMTAEKWMQLKRIFDAAQSKAPQERAELVRAMAEGDQELELAVRDLLAADESAGIFLQTPAAALHSPLLAPGARLGPYQILGLLGEGGMGEVYRAKDTRLERTVAIKILREHLSGNPQLRERFEREARAISSLSHPHICPLYDVGHQDGIDYLVMEYLEGETLASRLKKGPLPVDQMLQYAIQITDALDTAHKHGVIHRDLKPGNIMLTKNGARLLDFGLAKVRTADTAAGMTALHTQAAPLTSEGTILGTLQYMAPEQLEGGEADARTDIFALGAVIYEMATGRKAFDSKSQASLIAAILEREPPPISTIQPVAPRALDHVVRFCLAKQPEDRWQTSHDVLLQLKWIAGNGAAAQTTAPAAVGSFHKRGRLGWIVAACLSVALIALALAHFHEKPSDLHPIRFQIPTPDKVTLSWIDIPVVSPDGRRLVFTGATAAGKRLLWIRNLDTLAAEALPGTEGAEFPFWSPDSRFVAFLSLDKLNKIDLSDGSVQTLCHVPGSSGSGDWNQDGVILFSTPGPLLRVSAEGGEPPAGIGTEQIAPRNFAALAALHAGWPAFPLPGGERGRWWNWHFCRVAQLRPNPVGDAYHVQRALPTVRISDLWPPANPAGAKVRCENASGYRQAHSDRAATRQFRIHPTDFLFRYRRTVFWPIGVGAPEQFSSPGTTVMGNA